MIRAPGFYILSFLFISNSALACPELTGEYNCAYGTTKGIVNVSQKTTDDVVTYSFFDSAAPKESTVEIVTDGVVRAMPNSIEDMNISAECNENLLVVTYQTGATTMVDTYTNTEEGFKISTRTTVESKNKDGEPRIVITRRKQTRVTCIKK